MKILFMFIFLSQIYANTFFPFDSKFTWTYKTTISPVDDYELDYHGIKTIQTDQIIEHKTHKEIILREIDSYTNKYRFPRVLNVNGSTFINDVTFMGVGGIRVPGYRAQLMAPDSISLDSWDNGNWSAKVIGKEILTIMDQPINAVKVYVIGTYNQDYTIVGNYWLAKGIGIVKSSYIIRNYYVEEQLVEFNPL